MLTRGFCLATILLGSIAWPCSPSRLEPFTAKGNTDRKLTLEVSERGGSILKEKGAIVWMLPVSAFKVTFGPDDSWVAFAPVLDDTKVRVVATQPKATLFEIDLVSRLNKDEQSFLPFTSCGTLWFSGWKATAQGLKVFVTQNGQARPTQAAAAGIEFLIRADGTVTRETAALEVDVLKLADQWKGPASPARAELAENIARLSSTETGSEQAAKLAPFIKRVFATADASPPELDTAARLVGAVPAAEAKELVELILARPGWEAPLLWALPKGELRAALAERVFKDASRSGRARATAVRVATGEGHHGYGPLLKAALTDPNPEVRNTAGDNVGRAKCTDPLLTDVLAVLAKELAQPTKVPDNEWAHTRLVEHYQMAVRRCMGDAADPSRHATVAAAIQGGLRLEPSMFSTPLIYLDLVAWAEQAAPQSVVELLALTEKACAAQKHDLGKDPLHRVVQWRVLRALKANDLREARAQLALLKPKSTYDRIPVLDTTDLGASWKVSGREERVSDFVARMEQRLDPGKPAPKKRK